MVTFNPTVISMAFTPEPLVQIQNNFTELFLMMPSISSPSSKNMWLFCLECVILQTGSELICRSRMHSPEINLKHFYLLLLLLLLGVFFCRSKQLKSYSKVSGSSTAIKFGVNVHLCLYALGLVVGHFIL